MAAYPKHKKCAEDFVGVGVSVGVGVGVLVVVGVGVKESEIIESLQLHTSVLLQG